MGITTTTHLGLIKPDLNEKIKEDLPTFTGWATQNGQNMDKIDALFRAQSITWTPTWSASTSNPTLGTGGFVEGKLLRVFPRLALGLFRIFTGGAGFAGGSGFYRLSMPVTIDPSLLLLDDQYTNIGKAAFLDSSAFATSSNFNAHYYAPSNHIIFRCPSGNSWGNVDPVAIGQNDRLSGYVIIPTQDA